jgi:catechol 2,3-dioxygenase-like lactoylglutathione lyase family enzyme
MINGIHGVIYTKDAEGVRAFFRDKLGFPFVDAGHGWLIFALPPSEIGIHPTEGGCYHELWLMCDDVTETVKHLMARGVEVSGPVTDEGFGLATAVKIPGGGELGLFEPKHPTALHLTVSTSKKTISKKKTTRSR